MNWKLEWKWESDKFYGGDYKYFENEEQAREFIETLKKNPYRKITSMYLTHTIRIIQNCANCTILFLCKITY